MNAHVSRRSVSFSYSGKTEDTNSSIVKWAGYAWSSWHPPIWVEEKETLVDYPYMISSEWADITEIDPWQNPTMPVDLFVALWGDVHPVACWMMTSET